MCSGTGTRRTRCWNARISSACITSSNDCNTNDVLDECDIADGTSTDCNENGIPDECEPNEDCNNNGAQDICVRLAAIYIILAWVFASYTRPIVVMLVIPLGFVGATLGHWLLGFDLTILSMVALIGLSGIVVNDSIILVTTIDERLSLGEPRIEAIIDGSRDRLRAVILTSLTTIGGLTPLIFETSLQAQFLIPMAVTIVFGLMVATLLVLLVVPALVAIQGDIGDILRRPGPAVSVVAVESRAAE